MAIDLSQVNISWLGWALIGIAAIVLVAAVLRLVGNLLHIILKGCGVVLLAVIVYYILRWLGVF